MSTGNEHRNGCGCPVISGDAERAVAESVPDILAAASSCPSCPLARVLVIHLATIEAALEAIREQCQSLLPRA